MSEYTYEQVMTALRKADAAGNAEDARRLAQIANEMRTSGSSEPNLRGGAGRKARRDAREPAERGPQMMRQVNRGIADAVGGVVDLLNPFDAYTGSARDGLTRAMGAAGIEVAQGEPENAWQAAQRGAGAAVAAAPMFAGGAAALSQAPGLVGRVAGSVAPSAATTGATAAEAVGGGLSGAASQGVRSAGGPEWLAQTAGIAAPAAFGAIAAAPGAVAALPGVRTARRMVAPFTEGGGMEVARQRMQSIVGGRDRAAELAGRVQDESPLGLTPAQQTEDPNLLGLERLAAEQDPNLRERLVRLEEASRNTARRAFELGEPDAARTFFNQRRSFHRANLKSVADAARTESDRLFDQASPRTTERDASTQTVDALKSARTSARGTEQQLWGAIDPSVTYTPQQSRSVAQDMIDRATQPWMQQDLPALSRDFADGNEYTFEELHAYYSSLRRQARNDRAGVQKNERRAANADRIADAILEDMGALDQKSPQAQAINEARAYSAAFHDVFDRGAVGRVLRRTVEGVEDIEPGLALDRTVGAGGTSGEIAAGQILRQGETAADGMPLSPPAAPEAQPFVEDYIRRMFADAAGKPTAQGVTVFDQGRAARFMRENKPLLDAFPDLRDTLQAAARRGERLLDVQKAIADRIASPSSARQVRLVEFAGKPADRAVADVLRSDNPAREARFLVREARKDTTGEALAGLKGAFALDLIGRSVRRADGQSTLNGTALREALSDPQTGKALRVVFDGAELSRFNAVARELAKLDGVSPADVGRTLSGSALSEIIRTAAGIVGANVGAQAGGSGYGSLQTANIGANRARDIVNRLTSDKASQIIADAIEDPKLFRALLLEPRSPRFDKEAIPRLLPYLVGATAAVATE